MLEKQTGELLLQLICTSSMRSLVTTLVKFKYFLDTPVYLRRGHSLAFLIPEVN